MASAKIDPVKKALEDVSEAAHALAVHGSGGYSLDTSALDVVFSRSLAALKDALEYSDEQDMYDPFDNIVVRIIR